MKQKYKKQMARILTGLIAVVAAFAIGTFTAQEVYGEEGTADDPYILTNYGPITWEHNKYYSVTSDVVINDRINVDGSVHLILGKDATLEAKQGIFVPQYKVLIIDGEGSLIATGKDHYAGIGDNNPTHTESAGTITIRGGHVEAIGGYKAAGIGGSDGSSGGSILIEGGEVIATGGYGAAGIGGGINNDGGRIEIVDGDIKATGGNGAAGIGGGNNESIYGDGETIIIEGGTITAASNGDNPGEAIGRGWLGADECNLTLGAVRVVETSPGTTADVPASDRAGACKDVYVKLTTCDPHEYEYGVCGYCAERDLSEVWYVDRRGDYVKCSNPEWIERGSHDLSDGVWYAASGECSVAGMTVNGTVNLILCDDAALKVTKGIYLTEGNKLIIWSGLEGTGTLTVRGTENYYAGIGTRKAGDTAGTLIVNGGNVSATGGNLGAGIGGAGRNGNGDGGKGGTVVINGGVVTATGGNNAAASKGGGAGIGGGGFKNPDNKGGNGGAVTINGGTVIAQGNDGGSSIGGGYRGKSGTLKIPQNGYELQELSIKDEYDRDVEVGNVSDKTYIKIIASSVPISYGISIEDEIEHGTVSCRQDAAYVDDIITLTVNPDSDYELKELKVRKGTSTSTVATEQVDDTTYTFKMPAQAVTVGAVFEIIPRMTAPTGIENLTYSGKPQALVEAGDTDVGTLKYAVMEADDSSETPEPPASGTPFDAAIPTATDAGSYHVWYWVDRGDNYDTDAVGGPITVTLGQAPLTITAKDKTLTYNGQTQGEGNTVYTDAEAIAERVTVEGLQGEDSLTSIKIFSQGDKINVYPIQVTGATVGNAGRDVTLSYEITYVDGKLTIKLPPATSIDNAPVVLDDAPLVYTGQPVMPVIKTIGGKVLDPDKDYTIRYTQGDTLIEAPTDAGIYTMTITGKGNFAGSTSTEFTIGKADGTLAATGNKVKAKSKTVKLKKAKKISADKAYTIEGTIGELTFSKVKANKKSKKFKVNATTGQIKVKKGLKKGRYKLTVLISDPGDKNHVAAEAEAIVKIRIRK